MGSPNNTQESYVRMATRRWRRGARGFRLCPRNRLSVRRLRTELLTFLGLVDRYVRMLARKLSSKGNGLGNSNRRSGSRRVLVGVGKGAAANSKDVRRPPPASFIRTNSFYSQAIADCVGFFKRNSMPLEDYGTVRARRYSEEFTNGA
jgi:hypothetical protein